MKVDFLLKKTLITDKNKELMVRKLQKLNKFFTEDAKSVIKIREEKGKKIVEVTVTDRKMIFRSERRGIDELSCIDEIIDILTRQIRKNKTKLEKRIYQDIKLDYEMDDEQDELEIVKEKEIFLEPMSEEDAILRMKMLGHTFFIFNNMQTERVSVAYIRKDGGYGIINTK